MYIIVFILNNLILKSMLAIHTPHCSADNTFATVTHLLLYDRESTMLREAPLVI